MSYEERQAKREKRRQREVLVEKVLLGMEIVGKYILLMAAGLVYQIVWLRMEQVYGMRFYEMLRVSSGLLAGMYVAWWLFERKVKKHEVFQNCDTGEENKAGGHTDGCRR